MHLVRLEISGFKSFAKKTSFDFASPVVAIVGPNGSGKSNVAEAIRFVLGEQSMKSMRGKRGEDMIWNGSNASPRANRGAVAITFDNSSRFLPLDFDEVVIERVVVRDGTNEYRLNESAVRLKDVLGLLAGANIGESGHHIISQGEADKIVSASARERREMLEDALGLKVFQYKKEESLRTLEKTEENMRQVEALRREVAPHLKFLKRQVEKVERAETLRTEAVSRFQAFFAYEEARLKEHHTALQHESRKAEAQLKEVADAIAKAKRGLESGAGSAGGKRIMELSEALDKARILRQAEGKLAAKLEGQLEALARASSEARVPATEISRLLGEAEAELAMSRGTIDMLTGFIDRLFKRLRGLIASGGVDEDTAALMKEKADAEARERASAKEEQRLAADLEAIRTELEESRAKERERERALFELAARERDLRHDLSIAEGDLERLGVADADFKRGLSEAASLIGRAVLDYAGAVPSGAVLEEGYEKEKRELEKIKIRLEEMGMAGGEDVMKEYREAETRDQFLEKELGDLASSAASLKGLIADLEAELGTRFTAGLAAVNDEFSRLFAILFDGGSASLVVTREPVRRMKSLMDEDDNGIPDELEKTVEGIDLALSIPRKRVKSLTMLSGGERALTSIALIFAMSSVNPPPFLVLDETDAALDEANSRRYGDMVAHLAAKSQLIVITHNRETMSRAGILYGVTMGGDGVSKVLSVQLDEAVHVAK